MRENIFFASTTARLWLCKFGAIVGQQKYDGIRSVKRIISHNNVSVRI
jgi:hypothetical protein